MGARWRTLCRAILAVALIPALSHAETKVSKDEYYALTDSCLASHAAVMAEILAAPWDSLGGELAFEAGNGEVHVYGAPNTVQIQNDRLRAMCHRTAGTIQVWFDKRQTDELLTEITLKPTGVVVGAYEFTGPDSVMTRMVKQVIRGKRKVRADMIDYADDHAKDYANWLSEIVAVEAMLLATVRE